MFTEKEQFLFFTLCHFWYHWDMSNPEWTREDLMANFDLCYSAILEEMVKNIFLYRVYLARVSIHSAWSPITWLGINQNWFRFSLADSQNFRYWNARWTCELWNSALSNRGLRLTPPTKKERAKSLRYNVVCVNIADIFKATKSIQDICAL